ncbi:MAG: reverse transcriptase domain-containing protein, partial [Candidatus Thiodiazotropha sp.]
MESVNIYSQNCRGLNAFQKRRDLFHLLHSKKYNIICLQDVHLEDKMETYVKHEWGNPLYLSGKNSNSRGVMVLFNNNFEYEVGKIIRDADGNYIILEVTIGGKKIILVNIYGPNDDKPQFYKEIKLKILSLENDHVILCGDWNLVLDQEMDTENYVNINNPRARAVVLDFLLEDNYVDAWRVLNEGKKSYTWRKFNPERKQSRLDYFLLSEELFQYVMDCSILSGYRTDHSGVLLKLKLEENDRGRGYWKFNNSLLKDTEYIKKIKDTINDVKNTYKIPRNDDNNHILTNRNDDNNSNNNTPNATIVNDNDILNNDNNNRNSNDNNNNNDINEDTFSINDQLLLETILLLVRGETIKYSSRKKKQNMEKEIQLESEIKELEQNINDNLMNINREIIDSLIEKKNTLAELRQNKIDGVMLRSRCRYEDLGEKPTGYFLNLENRNYTNKVITKIIDESGNEFSNPKDIIEEQRKYYAKLYKEEIDIDDTSIESVIGSNPNKLSEIDAMKLEGEITYTELAHALQSMKNSKSPGNDGYTAEFFKFFWKDLGMFVLKSLNFAYKTDSLSVTQKQGIITCLPKPNKSRFHLKNWRPISLLNVVYKMASTVIANRLKTVLQNIIHEDQKGFLSGRFIGENIRIVYDILFETKQQNIPGLLLSVDFQQAFDSVSWKFINKTLDYYNFGPSFKKWIALFQNGSESAVLQNGFISEFFPLQRGCRQGDPISPYIFILCVEILGLMIRRNDNIHGVRINDSETKLSQYADDTQIFLDGSEISLRTTLTTLQTFYLMSGLQINVEKTRAVWIGAMSKSERKLCHEFKLDWNQNPLKILGVVFTTEVYNIWEHNTEVIFHRVDSILRLWGKRKLTLPGRIAVIKSLALSKFIHLFTALHNPPDELIKGLESRFYKFLWNNGPDRISRKNIIKDTSVGGLRMINIKYFIKSLKVTWFRRYI